MNLARRLHRRGQLNEAKKFAQKAGKRAKDKLGRHHHLVSRCAQELSQIEESQRRPMVFDSSSSAHGTSWTENIELQNYGQMPRPAPTHTRLPTVDEFELPGTQFTYHDTAQQTQAQPTHARLPVSSTDLFRRPIACSEGAHATLNRQPSSFSLLASFTHRYHVPNRNHNSMVSELGYIPCERMNYIQDGPSKSQANDSGRGIDGQGHDEDEDRRRKRRHDRHRRRKRVRAEPEARDETNGWMNLWREFRLQLCGYD